MLLGDGQILSQLAEDQGALGRQECQAGACFTSSLLSRAEWNVSAVPRPNRLLLDKGAFPGASGAHGTEGSACGEEGAWGGRARNRGRWALGWRSEDPALRPPAEAPHSRLGHRGHRSACGGLAAGSGGAAAPAQQSRAEPSAQPGRRRLAHAIAATKSSLNPGGRAPEAALRRRLRAAGRGEGTRLKMARKRKPPSIQGESLSSPRPHPSLWPAGSQLGSAKWQVAADKSLPSAEVGWGGVPLHDVVFLRFGDSRGGVCHWFGTWGHLETLVTTLLPYTVAWVIGFCCFLPGPPGQCLEGEKRLLLVAGVSLSPSPVLNLHLYLHLSLFPSLLHPRVTSSTFIFSTFPFLGGDDFLSLSLSSNSTLLSRGFATSWVLAGCCPGGQGLQRVTPLLLLWK